MAEAELRPPADPAEEFYAALSNEEKAVMGDGSMPPRDEHERIDIKGRYDDLRPRVADYR